VSAQPQLLVGGPWRAAEVIEVEGVVRRVVAGRVRCREDVEDLVQDAFVRIEGARDRLTPEGLVPYAAVVARNLACSQGRAVLRASRYAHLQVDLREEPQSAAASVELADEAQAMRAAMGRLEVDDRALLLARDVDGTSTALLAAARGTSLGGVRVQLTRVRAKLRLEFLLTFRRIGELPTRRCRPVLLAISGADGRRQTALAASDHLNQCRTCEDLAVVLFTRRRSAA